MALKAQMKNVTMEGLTDAFGRVRTAEPVTLWDSKFDYAVGGLRWDTKTVNNAAATHQEDERTVSLTVKDTNTSRVVLQSRYYVPYQPGKSRLIFITFNAAYTTHTTGVRFRVGCYDEHGDKDGANDSGGNGHFFEVQEDGTLAFVERSYVTGSEVDTTTTQSSWNIDPLDGTGNSGIDLDATKVQILFIDLEWLGAGVVRLGFVIDGVLIYAHQIVHANTSTTAYMSSASLPIRYELTNVSADNDGGGDVVGTARAICSTVISEGGRQHLCRVVSTDSGITSVSIDNTKYWPVLSVRAAPAYCRTILDVLSVALMTVSNATDITWRVYIGGTLTDASWANVDGASPTNSFAQVDVAATAITGGHVLASGYIASEVSFDTMNGLQSSILAGADIDGTTSIITIAAKKITAGSGAVFAAMRWREIE